MRGDVFELPSRRDAQGHEQRGRRYCVVVQSDQVLVSTVVVCPTSSSARSSHLRPSVRIKDKETHVLAEQIVTIDPQRLGKKVGRLLFSEMQDIDRAIKLTLDLR